MAILINDNYSLAAQKPFDARYLNITSPWTSVAAVNAAIPTYRYRGLTVNIMGVEYWYGAGVADGDLVIKDSGLASTGITSATNGLTKIGNTVKLGGTLTGVTTLTAAGGTALLQYGSDYSPNYVARTIPDAGWVTGRTSQAIQTAGNGLTKLSDKRIVLGGALTGTTTINGAQTLNINQTTLNLSGNTAFGLRYGTGTLTNAGSTTGLVYAAYYGATNVAQSIPDAQWVTGKTQAVLNCYAPVINSALTGATNGLCKYDSRNVCLGGALSSSIIIGTGSNTFGVCAGKVNLTGASVNLGGCVTLKSTPPNLVGDVLTYNSSTGEISKTTLSGLGGLTGATNGLGTSNQKVCLGGVLIAGTSITGAQALCLGTAASKLANINLYTSGATTIVTGSLPISSSGATFTDLTVSAKQGIKYASDYSLTYNVRTLVDKGYVDTVATGLHVQTAVKVATTTSISLANSQTIDGIAVSNSDRVLVKNQGIGTTGSTANGIYIVVDAGAWTRATDYNTSAEISNGDLIPVTTGDTQHNTLWVLTTQNPITLNTTPLEFTLFATVTDVHAGAGIAISQVGGQHTVCVLLPGGSGTACGLAVTNTGLCIDSNIAGTALSYTTGVLNVCAVNCGTVPYIPVGYNTGSDALVVACSDLRTAISAITGATNGLTSASCVVKLGGALCETTTISGAQSLRVNTCYFNVTGTTGLCLSTGCGVITTTNNKGLEYGANYNSTFDNESLITKRYVCSQTSGITGAITSANNGLTKLGQNVVLGGALTGNTVINIAGKALEISGNSKTITNFNGGEFSVGDYATSQENYLMINTSTSYADIYVSSSGGTKVGEVILDGSNGNASLLATKGSIQQGVAASGQQLDTRIFSYSGGCNTEIGLSHGKICVRSNVSGFKGIEYCSGTYRNNFICSSLVDAAYVTGRTSTSGIQSACNGLTKQGTEVKLGGALTGNTSLTGAYSLILTGGTKLNTQCGYQISGTTIFDTSRKSLSNINIGCQAGNSTGTGTNNTAIGYQTLYLNTTTGSNNIAIGYQALSASTSSGNVAIGSKTLSKLTTGNCNIAIGYFALECNSNVNENIAIGLCSLINNNAHNNIGIGSCALNRNTTGTNNVGIGICANYNNQTGSTNIAIGREALGNNLCGSRNHAIGCGALYSNSKGCDNVAIGQMTLYSNSCGCFNTAIGCFALVSNTIGCNNIAIGNEAFRTNIGNSNIGIGYCAGASNVTGSGSTFIGKCAGYSETTSNKLYIDNTATTQPLIWGDFATNCLVVYGMFATSGETKLLVAPAAGSTSDSVLVRDSGGIIKTVAGSSLGDKNNVYSKTIVSGNATGTTASTYVQLMSGATSFTLPSAPTAGQVFKIKDAIGTALSTNIIINAGSGKTIDGSQCALINTDYGALELVYGATNKWFSLAFVN